jgi:L-iditol 2-dehydrogenase
VHSSHKTRREQRRHSGPRCLSPDIAASGRVDLDSIVTDHFGLADVEVALTASRSDPTAIKVMVKPGE